MLPQQVQPAAVQELAGDEGQRLRPTGSRRARQARRSARPGTTPQSVTNAVQRRPRPPPPRRPSSRRTRRSRRRSAPSVTTGVRRVGLASRSGITARVAPSSGLGRGCSARRCRADADSDGSGDAPAAPSGTGLEERLVDGRRSTSRRRSAGRSSTPGSDVHAAQVLPARRAAGEPVLRRRSRRCALSNATSRAFGRS